jgi:hypothetical protein
LPWELATAAVGPQAVAVVEGARPQPPRAAAVQQARGLERPQVLEPLQALVNLLQVLGRHRPWQGVGIGARIAEAAALGSEVEHRARGLRYWRLVTQTRKTPRWQAPLLQALPPPGYPQQVGRNRHWLRQAKPLPLRHLHLRGLGHRGVG